MVSYFFLNNLKKKTKKGWKLALPIKGKKKKKEWNEIKKLADLRAFLMKNPI